VPYSKLSEQLIDAYLMTAADLAAYHTLLPIHDLAIWADSWPHISHSFDVKDGMHCGHGRVTFILCDTLLADRACTIMSH